MKLKSLIMKDHGLIPVEVEITFVPGLPQIQFLGLPDQLIKESIHRIKSAIRSQGFQFPQAQQVLVNLRPAHLKKSSRGLELAVALGILAESEQIPQDLVLDRLCYGELTLYGEVFEPDDLVDYLDESLVVTTGATKNRQADFPRWSMRELRSVLEPEFIPPEEESWLVERPQLAEGFKFSSEQAKLLQITALGLHPILLAGPAGSGKSTFAKSLISYFTSPTEAELKVLSKSQRPRTRMQWWPLVAPHHTVTALGMVGGGVPLVPGEISRAHQGLLLLDELLEFQPSVLEALREPMEEHQIHLRRGREFQSYPAQALYVATTNLCPCGDWIPKTKVVCNRSLKKCQSYLERLSGPVVDRFQVLHFFKREKGDLGFEEILSGLEVARNWRARQSAEGDERFNKPASRWSWEELCRNVDVFYLRELMPQQKSRRRELATLRVARSLADLRGSLRVETEDMEQAMSWTYNPFLLLQKGGLN